MSARWHVGGRRRRNAFPGSGPRPDMDRQQIIALFLALLMLTSSVALVVSLF